MSRTGTQSLEAKAFWAANDCIKNFSPKVAGAIVKELEDQRNSLKLIASENYSSLRVQLAMGNLLTDKYSEGYVGRRFYAGCENVDTVEKEAMDLAKELFQAEHAYVQPHSGADANLVAFWAILLQRVQSKELERLGKKSIDELCEEEYERVRQLLVNQKIMGMSLGSGGHLTHGYRHNVSAKMFRAVSYDVDFQTGFLDYKALEKKVMEEKPLILIAGYSAYPRKIDFAILREIADKANAVLMVDMAHFAGLVAGKVFQGNFNPIPFAHVVTTTTHKTLRGPRGGMVLCKEEFRETVDKGCPIVLGGPLPHVMAAKAVAFKEALSSEFQSYAEQIVKNAKVMGEELSELGGHLLTGGTDNHLFVLDTVRSYSLTGRQAESILRKALCTVNRNAIPNDPNGAWYTSGVRIGTPAITSLGMKEGEMKEIASIIHEILSNTKGVIDAKTKAPSKAKTFLCEEVLTHSRDRIKELLKGHPLYPELE